VKTGRVYFVGLGTAPSSATDFSLVGRQVEPGSEAEFSVNDGEWTSLPTTVFAGDSVRVRHTSSPNIGEVTETVVAVGLENGASRTDTVFYSVTSEPDTVPDCFDFGTRTDVIGNTSVESDVADGQDQRPVESLQDGLPPR
jgi:hypothetical protein